MPDRVFITIDPERDTKVLAEYLAAFYPSFVGLTGSEQELRQVANFYKAFYAKVPVQRARAIRSTTPVSSI